MSQKSRIDLWLISASALSSSNITAAPLTDHVGIDLSISNSNSRKQRIPGYWKLNSSFLQLPAYCSGIKEIINVFTSKNDISSISKWELFKFECRKFSIKFSKQYTKTKKLRATNILKEINDILNIPLPNDENKTKLHSLQEILNVLYIEKAKGAFVRSRSK